MRARGFSSCVISSVSRSALVVGCSASTGDEPPADSTEMWVDPSWVLFRRRAVLAAVSFSKVTVADLVSPSALTSRLVILPLEGRLGMLAGTSQGRTTTYQKLKKSRISLSSVLPAMFLTLTVVADMMKTVRGRVVV